MSIKIIHTDPKDAALALARRNDLYNAISLTKGEHDKRNRELFRKWKLEEYNVWRENREGLIEMWNSNAIDSQLQRQMVLLEALEAFALIISRFDVFCAVYQGVPLEGTDKIEVPYLPLQANGSSSFSAATGYNTVRDWTMQKREIVIGGDGDTTTSGANAAANTAKDRAYIALSWTSYDLSRQPFLTLVDLTVKNLNRLATDIWTAVVSRVVTAANFPNKRAVGNVISGSTCANLREDATGLQWPQSGRNLVLDHTKYTSLLQDPNFKAYVSYGTSDPIRRDRVPSAYGFDLITEIPNLAATYAPAGENMIGWMNHKSAVLLALSNIVPSPEVRILCNYMTIVHPSGISFAYRRQADMTLDKTVSILEASFGAERGVDTALERLTTV